MMSITTYSRTQRPTASKVWTPIVFVGYRLAVCAQRLTESKVWTLSQYCRQVLQDERPIRYFAADESRFGRKILIPLIWRSLPAGV
jgi:hypothetical protein